MLRINFFFLLFYLTLLICQGQTSQNVWSIRLPNVGSLSSPRVADLNEDGVGDVILGIGRIEFQSCDTAIAAFDGKTGAILWKLPAEDQIFGSANLMDITDDGVPDVFIGGRSAELQAVNGKTGALIWKFLDPDKNKRRKNKRWFNFYNPQFVADQDGDGLKDILISNGGDVMVAPYDPKRPVGHLAVISSKDGSILAFAAVPDGKEIYMSIAAIENEGKWEVIFGTGGETIGGNLYVTTLADIMSEDLSNSIKLDSSPNKGYIGPPLWIDINGDQHCDIVANSVDGRLLTYDGRNKNKIWEVFMPNTEAYTSISAGHFNSDRIPDFFVSYAQGVWPNLDWTKQFMVNGVTGDIEFKDSLGFYQTVTPVIANFDQDKQEEALVVVNYQIFNESNQKYFNNMLLAIDFTTNELIDLGINYEGHNMASTPWIGDLDMDGFLDIIHCHSSNPKKTYAFDGMQINRIKTTFPISSELKCGAYMGSNYDGIIR